MLVNSDTVIIPRIKYFLVEILNQNYQCWNITNGSSESYINDFITLKCAIKNFQQICMLENPSNFSSYDPNLAHIMVQKDIE